MPNPWKDPELQQRMKDWIAENPDRWYTARYQDIAAETSVSLTTLTRYYPLLVAQVANIPPSEVQDKRREHLGQHPLHRKLPDEEIAKIVGLYEEGKTTLDIAYMTGRSPTQVEKYDPNRKKTEDHDGNQTPDSSGEN